MRAIGFLMLISACSRHPDGGPMAAPEPAWARVEVPECGFSVELPGAVARTVDRPTPDVPATVMYTATASRAGLMVECTVFDRGELPANDHVLSAWIDRHRRTVAGLGGGITSTTTDPEPGGASTRYAIHFAQGKTLEGRVVIVDAQIRDLSGMTDGGHETRRDLDRMFASYR